MVHRTDDASQPISVEGHLARILATTRVLAPVQIPLTDASGRVLATDVVATVNVPSFDNSAMDGYAVRFSDVADASDTNPVSLSVVADLPAGSAENPGLSSGQAARIMTGAPVPDDADCIVPVEDTDGGSGGIGGGDGTGNDAGTVLIRRAPQPAAHIRRIGTDVYAGEMVLTKGRVLNARDLAAAAATGTATLLVYPAPRVGVLSTGTELVHLGGPLRRGQIHDSNSTLLAGMVAECGAIPVQIGSVPDDPDALRETLARYAQKVDAFITSGGVSVGAYDVVKAVLAPLGVWFGPVRMQPGKPQGYGQWPGSAAGNTSGTATGSATRGSYKTPIFTLPGNPVSVFVSFEAFVRPALLAMQGHSNLSRQTVAATVTLGWRSPQGRRQFMPVLVAGGTRHDANFTVRPASSGGSGSYLVASLAGANALATVPEDVTEVHEGDVLDVTLLS